MTVEIWGHLGKKSNYKIESALCISQKSLKENGEETDVIVKGNLAWGGGDEAHVKVERVKYHVVLVVQ